VLLFASRSLAAASPVSSGSPVIITTITPGFCKSDIFRDDNFTSKMMKVFGNLIGRETEVGSRTLVDAASSVHGREVHGQFLWDCKVSKYVPPPYSNPCRVLRILMGYLLIGLRVSRRPEMAWLSKDKLGKSLWREWSVFCLGSRRAPELAM